MTAFKKKVLALALAGTFALSQSAFVSAAEANTSSTIATKYVAVIGAGLIKGDGKEIAGDNPKKMLERYRAFTLKARLLGMEKDMSDFIADASKVAAAENFDDTDGKSDYVKGAMAYFKSTPEIGADGMGNNEFKALTNVTGQQFYKMMLEALGYEQGTDFEYTEVPEKAVEVKLVADAALVTEKAITEAEIGAIMYDTLAASFKGETQTLAKKLATEKGITAYEKIFDMKAPVIKLTEPGVLIDGTTVTPDHGTYTQTYDATTGVDTVTTSTVDMVDGMEVEGYLDEPGYAYLDFNGVRTTMAALEASTLDGKTVYKFAAGSKTIFKMDGTPNVVSVYAVDLAGNKTTTLKYDPLGFTFAAKSVVADTSGGIRVTMSGEIDPNSLGDASKAIYNEAGVEVDNIGVSLVANDPTQVYVVAKNPLILTKAYTLSLSGLRNTSGMAMKAITKKAAKVVADTVSPTIIKSSRIASNMVQLDFSEPILNKSFEILTNYKINGNAFAGKIEVTNNRCSVLITNNSGFVNGNNIISFPSVFDDANYPIAPYTYVYGADVVAPTVNKIISVSPYSVTVEFSEMVRVDSLIATNAFVSFDNQVVPVPAFTRSVLGDNKVGIAGQNVAYAMVVTYNFAAPLYPNINAKFTVSGVRDLAGNLMAGSQSLNFLTSTATAATEPAVVSVSQTGINEFSVEFSRTISFGLPYYNASYYGDNLAKFITIWDKDGNQLVGSNSDATKIQYTVSDHWTGKKVVVTLKGAYADNYQGGLPYTFRLNNIYDKANPTVVLNDFTSRSVVMGDFRNPQFVTARSVVQSGKYLYITFDMKMDADTVKDWNNYGISITPTSAPIRLYDLQDWDQDSITLSEDGMTAIISCRALAGAAYQLTAGSTVTVANLKSALGVAAAPMTFTYSGTTRPTAGPQINAVKVTGRNSLTVYFENAAGAPVTNVKKGDIMFKTGVNQPDLLAVYANTPSVAITGTTGSAITYTFASNVFDTQGRVTFNGADYINLADFNLYLVTTPTTSNTYNQAVSFMNYYNNGSMVATEGIAPTFVSSSVDRTVAGQTKITLKFSEAIASLAGFGASVYVAADGTALTAGTDYSVAYGITDAAQDTSKVTLTFNSTLTAVGGLSAQGSKTIQITKNTAFGLNGLTDANLNEAAYFTVPSTLLTVNGSSTTTPVTATVTAGVAGVAGVYLVPIAGYSEGDVVTIAGTAYTVVVATPVGNQITSAAGAAQVTELVPIINTTTNPTFTITASGAAIEYTQKVAGTGAAPVASVTVSGGALAPIAVTTSVTGVAEVKGKWSFTIPTLVVGDVITVSGAAFTVVASAPTANQVSLASAVAELAQKVTAAGLTVTGVGQVLAFEQVTAAPGGTAPVVSVSHVN